jgi:hypothetical protein
MFSLSAIRSLKELPFHRNSEFFWYPGYLTSTEDQWSVPRFCFKGETADLGFWDFLRFWDFLGFFEIFLGTLKIQKNRKWWNFRLNYSSYIGFVVLRISWNFQRKRMFPSRDNEIARNTHIPLHYQKIEFFENSIFLKGNICSHWKF